MLVEIAAANAAFNILKTALSNGKELYDCSEAASQFFDNKSVIAKRVAAKGQSDFQAFMALEQIKEHEAILRETMIYSGRANLWSDWLSFQSECKKTREKELRVAFLKKQKSIRLVVQIVTAIGTAAAIVPVLIYLFIYLTDIT